MNTRVTNDSVAEIRKFTAYIVVATVFLIIGFIVGMAACGGIESINIGEINYVS